MSGCVGCRQPGFFVKSISLGFNFSSRHFAHLLHLQHWDRRIFAFSMLKSEKATKLQNIKFCAQDPKVQSVVSKKHATVYWASGGVDFPASQGLRPCKLHLPGPQERSDWNLFRYNPGCMGVLFWKVAAWGRINRLIWMRLNLFKAKKAKQRKNRCYNLDLLTALLIWGNISSSWVLYYYLNCCFITTFFSRIWCFFFHCICDSYIRSQSSTFRTTPRWTVRLSTALASVFEYWSVCMWLYLSL